MEYRHRGRRLLPDEPTREKPGQCDRDGRGGQPDRAAEARVRRRGLEAWRRKTRQRLQVEGDVRGGLEPPLRVLLQTVADDPVETRRDVLVGGGEVRRIFL